MTDVIVITMLTLAAIPLVLFIYRYARYSPWSSTLQGRGLFAQKWAMLALILLGIASRIIDAPWLEVARVVLFSVLVSLFWVMLYGLVEAQNSDRSKDDRRGYREDTEPRTKKEEKKEQA